MTRDEGTHHALICELAKAMRTELHDNRDKGHWLDSTPEELLAHAAEELGELAAAVRRGESRERLFSEAADLACLAAMVADSASARYRVCRRADHFIAALECNAESAKRGAERRVRDDFQSRYNIFDKCSGCGAYWQNRAYCERCGCYTWLTGYTPPPEAP